MSQAELGKCVGVSQSQISRAESNPDGLTVEMLKRIADALGKRG
jgi:transcriptional regulator with XRE-family HTH domain